MKQVLFDRSGKVKVEDVPLPNADRNMILVSNKFSLISSGTEKSMIELMKKPLYKMAIERMDLTRQVIRFAQEKGIKKTMDLVKSRLDVWHMLGYSCCGKVLKVGSGIEGIGAGDLVSCTGSGFANHSEYVCVPKNMFAKVPKGVEPKEAAFAGIGSIALQSVRQLNPTLGETHVVIGLGLIGQLTCQILKANGCKVIGIDIDKKKLAKPYIDLGLTGSGIANITEISRFTKGYGADGIIIAAATKANLINDSFDMCRRKGRVVLLGVCDLNIDRSKMYEKELEFKISTAFGPGYYDPGYEKKNIDYPIGYVRWTMQRNMEAFLELIREKKIDVINLIEEIFSISDAEDAYDKVLEKNMTAALLRYDPKTIPDDEVIKKIREIKPLDGKIRVGIIGAGNFIKGFIIPSLKKIDDFQIIAIATQNGNNAKKLAKELGAGYATTDYRSILNDNNIDLVIIGTRHDTHAEIAIEAINAGKHVFVEKPAAIFEDELTILKKTLDKSRKDAESTKDKIMVLFSAGFNRRYSPAIIAMKGQLKKGLPLMANYVFNNTYLPKEHWVNQRDIGGGRVIGEACHIIDLFNFLTEARPLSISAEKITSTSGEINDDNNILATIKYEDGSVCSLLYCCMGNSNVSRERCIIFQDGNAIEMDNFLSVKLNGKNIYTGNADEGHHNEMVAIRDALIQGSKQDNLCPDARSNKKDGADSYLRQHKSALAVQKPELITADEVILATELTFAVMKLIKGQGQ